MVFTTKRCSCEVKQTHVYLSFNFTTITFDKINDVTEEREL